MNWNFQGILIKDPSSAWGCDTSGNILLCGVALRRTCRCFTVLKTQICVTLRNVLIMSLSRVHCLLSKQKNNRATNKSPIVSKALSLVSGERHSIYVRKKFENLILFFPKKNSPSIIQINQPTRRNNFSSLLRDVYLQLNMFRESSRPSSGAQQLQ